MTKAWGAPALGKPLEPVEIQRRELRKDDVHIDIEFAGICHSDIHTVQGDWGDREIWPLVPGHEIVGRVSAVGDDVLRFRVGDLVGVGCFINSCGDCGSCHKGEHSYCENGAIGTYGSRDKYTDNEYSQGGYSQDIVVKEDFVVRVPESLDPAAAAPLLCAGITTYSPLKHWGAGPGKKVAVVGMGGLGHVAVKIAVAMGAEVTVLGHSESKRADAIAYGATEYFTGDLREKRDTFDLILNTVSVDLPTEDYMRLLAVDGTMVMLGLPGKPLQVHTRHLTGKRRSLAGSMVGGIPETQEMLDFCAEHGILPEIELIKADYINEAYDRTIKADVKYRFVIDASTL